MLAFAFPVDVLTDEWDIATLIIGGIAAIGTLLAVWVAVADSRQANKRAAAAEGEARSARQETADLRDLQDQRRAREQTADLSLSGAAHVEVVDAFVFAPAGQDGRTTLEVTVLNGGPQPISNIIVLVAPPISMTRLVPDPKSKFVGRSLQISRGARASFNEDAWIHANYDPNLDEPQFTVLFTDHLNNRWRLAPDSSLFLTEPRVVDIDPAPVDEAVFAS